ncbi:MAG: NADH-quinone oxidoreductase subunit NuoN [Casimicrobiaceae bacterium]|nr:NADH-quinone oxidoreductase subunit NuoN [Casimicrobiaceae bacterium]
MNDLKLVLPEMILLALACALLVGDLFVPRERKRWSYAFGVWVLIATAIAVWVVAEPLSAPAQFAFSKLVVLDGVATILKVAMLASAALALAYSWDYLRKHGLDHGEFVALALFSVLGMVVIASAANLLTAYLGLELLSLSMYALVALKRDDRIATEAAMKYFVLGALASGLLLFGMSILYGATGSLDLMTIAQSLGGANRVAIALGFIFIAAGVAFKLGVVPFHMWVPDVYQGAPTAVTLFLGVAPKIAAFALAYRLFAESMQGALGEWRLLLALIALLSVVFGNLIAIAQTAIKRMLAYSAIANMGFLLLGIVAGGREGFTAACFYAVAYAVTGLVALGVIVVISGRGHEIERIEDLSGLNQKSPWLAFLVLVAMVSLAGLPPTLGFWAKLGVLEALVDAGHVWMAVIAVLASLIGAFFYLRVVKVAYFNPANESVRVPALAGASGTLLSLNALAVLVLGALPGTLMSVCAQAVQASLR